MTIHGLSKVLTGYLWEKILWFAVLFACYGIVIHFTYGFYAEYKRFDMRTEIRLKSSQKITLPSATICEEVPYSIRTLHYKGKLLSEVADEDSAPQFLKIPLYKKIKQEHSYYSKYFIPHQFLSHCVIFNHYANITSNMDAIKIDFWGNSSQKLYISFQDQNDLIGMQKDFDAWRLDFEKFEIKEGEFKTAQHSIIFSSKQIITRLPSPYPSECSYGQYQDNILPGNYTEQKCRYTCYIRKVINECGALADEWLTYAPQLKRLLPAHNNRSNDEVRQCLFHDGHIISAPCECRMSCHQVNIKYKHEVNPDDKHRYLSFIYPSNTYTEVSEIPTYPPEKFVTDIGGWVGLFSGMSILSVLEVILFAILTLLAAYHKFRQAIASRRQK